MRLESAHAGKRYRAVIATPSLRATILHEPHFRRIGGVPQKERIGRSGRLAYLAPGRIREGGSPQRALCAARRNRVERKDAVLHRKEPVKVHVVVRCEPPGSASALSDVPLGCILLSAVVVRIKFTGDHALVRIVPRKHEIALVGRVRNRRPKREIPSQDKPPCLSAVNGRRADVIAVEFPVGLFAGARVDKPDVRSGEGNLIVALSERRGGVRHLA